MCKMDDWLLKRSGPNEWHTLSYSTGATLTNMYAVDVIQNVEVELATFI